jgi:hypothetical protein
VTEKKTPLESKLGEKTEIVGVPGTPMTPEEAQANMKQVEEEQKRLTEPGERNVPPDSEINKDPQPSDPETIRSARSLEKESGESKAKRVDTADVSPEGEKAPAGWGKKPTVYAMTNVDGEKLLVTVKQWAKYGQKLRAKGWTTPEFAQGDQGGNEEIPPNVDWGKDSPDEPAPLKS